MEQPAPSGTSPGAAAAAPVGGGEAALPPELLSHIFESLPLGALGRANCACRRWRESGSSTAVSLWQVQARQLGYTWGWSDGMAHGRAARQGGWKSYVRHELKIEQRWYQPHGRALQARVLKAGHQHWVPTILMDAQSRELVTCSYDGTVRFWSHADAARPGCFKVLRAGVQEGFSCINTLSHPSGSVLLAAGSELGHVHVWEVWRPEDAEDAKEARERLLETSKRSPLTAEEILPAGSPYQSSPQASQGPWSASTIVAAGTFVDGDSDSEGFDDDDLGDDDGDVDVGMGEDGADGADDDSEDHEMLSALETTTGMPPRPHFSRKVARWAGAHDFVQSILLLPAAGGASLVLSGGDSGFVRLHTLGTPACHVSLAGHSGAVMCLDAPRGDDGCAAADVTAVYSGSVDHTIGRWDLVRMVRSATLEGHSRSVHCLAVARGGAWAGGENVLFTGSRDHTIKVWDLRTRACEHTLHGHTGSVTCLGSHGWRLVSGGGYNRGADDDEVLSVDSSIKLWDLRQLGSPGRTRPIWSREAPSPKDADQNFGQPLPPGDPVLSLQLMESKLLTSHGGKQWTARIWDVQ
jgi:WD40 repeat protein